MFERPTASVLHADLDAFFASVEQRDDRTLRGRPVIVGGGVVLGASYEAKAYGVRTAMGGRQARRLSPHAVVVPPRMSVYADASNAVTLAGSQTATSPLPAAFAKGDNQGWSIYGAERSQPVATGGKWNDRENGSDAGKPLPW